MKAQFKGSVCPKCNKEIQPGEEIFNNGTSWAHEKCNNTEPEPETKPAPREPQAKNMTVKLVDPFQESELIISIVKNFSYKAVTHARGITDMSLLKKDHDAYRQFEIDIAHTENNFLECILRLREINGIKSDYAKK